MDEYSTLFGPPAGTNFAVKPTQKQVIEALATLPHTASGAQEQLSFHCKEYRWHSVKNRDDAQRYLHAGTIASEYQLEWQVQLYARELFYLVTKDAAEQTQYLVKQQLHYRSSVYALPREKALPTQRFRVPVPDNYGANRYEWLYYPIAEFAKLIPPQALGAMSFVEQYSVPAEAYWVADKLKVLPVRSVSVDPLLYAQYGRWFVSIAQWL